MLRSAACAALPATALATLAFSLLSTTAMAQTAASAPAMPAASVAEAEDPYLWLEQVEGERAMAWVREHNAHSLGVLQSDPRYQGFYDQALAISQSRARIPSAGFNRDGTVDNFWQDADHVRGVWRRATLDSYRGADPVWETVLDIDALSAAEGANWVYKGVACLQPEERYCLVSLSDGGKDAITIREYDTVERRWVEGGFVLPESKGGATWIDRDTLLIARDFGQGSLTTSGYPMTVRRLKRGQSLDQAEIVFTGQPTDVSVGAYTLRDADGALKATLLHRGVTTWESETWRLNADGATTRLALPARSSIDGMVGDHLIVTMLQDWTSPSGQAFRIGDVAAYDADAWLADPMAPGEVVIRPGERESVEAVTATRNTLVAAVYDNVRGGVYVYRPREGGGWDRSRLDLPQNVTVGLGSASEIDDKIFVNLAGYLNPSSLWLADAATGAVEQIKSLPPMFDATGLTVEQFQARSADGTMIPYFVVHREGMTLDGSNPTLLGGYGGFQVSQLPGYSGTIGKLWLENGGVYARANIRGGGEFGPRWHQAALQQNRQRAHEDFQAVAADLIARGVTSPRRLGVIGGSQGGLLMGTMLTQRPDLINAAVIQVPLFDMMRYHQLLAGASWMAEYGDPDDPAQWEHLRTFSPYHLFDAARTYPPVLFTTSTKDDRVHPGHARKLAALMLDSGKDVTYYENIEGGHGGAATNAQAAHMAALAWSFLTQRLR